MNMIVFCDIDGVLADCTHRLHYLKEKNYARFYNDQNVIRDEIIPSGYELVRAFQRIGAEIHFVSSRNELCRGATMEWLYHKASIRKGIVAMRNKSDFRPSPIVKVELVREVYRELRSRMNGYLTTQDVRPSYFIDDDPENVKAVCEAYPRITGIIFGTERMKK